MHVYTYTHTHTLKSQIISKAYRSGVMWPLAPSRNCAPSLTSFCNGLTHCLDVPSSLLPQDLCRYHSLCLKGCPRPYEERA